MANHTRKANDLSVRRERLRDLLDSRDVTHDARGFVEEGEPDAGEDRFLLFETRDDDVRVTTHETVGDAVKACYAGSADWFADELYDLDTGDEYDAHHVVSFEKR